MNRFDKIRFKGDFRSYQQRVLDNADKYLADGKVNIVAAPGSGKTVLGLELIRKLGEPCLILSTTKDIRDQWGQRLKEHFLEDESRFEELFSTDLHRPKLINCITYEALSIAMERTKTKADGEISYFDIDLLKTLRRRGINTICLEEPHHLGNDKQKALEKFLECLGDKVMRICLTAIPPYDLDRTEWSRYYGICGEIDEEIFAPELVAQGSLCPHQDYVYFNYPTAEEKQVLQEHQDHVRKILENAQVQECLKETARNVTATYYIHEPMEKILKQFPQEMEALLVVLQYYDKIPDMENLQKKYGIEKLPEPENIYFQRALQFLVDEGTRFCAAEYVGRLRRVLQENHLYIDKKVTLCLPEETRKSFMFSVGKLKSIGDITCHEYRNLGKDLRMMILTDFNRGSKENLNKIGTDEPYEDISVVSIFETLRRLDDTMNIGVLSGSFMILPKEFVSQGTMVNLEPFEGTRYAKVEVYGTPREGMNLVRELLREGKLQVLIGTNVLLEDGWDEPCMNTLILANSVEPFASSNQMRGLVIESDPQNPDKTANIWHLVTLEPLELVQETILEQQPVDGEEEAEILPGYDYSVVKRSLDTFMTPHYETGNIENGMERLSLIQPPFDEKSVLEINKGMLELSEDRNKMSKAWKQQLQEPSFRVIAETAQSIVLCAPTFRYMRKTVTKMIRDFWLGKLIGAIMIVLCIVGIIYFWVPAIFFAILLLLVLLLVGVMPICLLFREYMEEIRLLSKHRILLKQLRRGDFIGGLEVLTQDVAKTLTDCGIITSGSSVVVEKVEHDNRMVRVRLQNATRHDQSIFNKAIGELMAPIDNPRYLLVPQKATSGDRQRYSLPCPSIIGQKESYVKVLEKYLEKNLYFMELVDTTKYEGRELLKQCRKYYDSRHLGEVYGKEISLEADTKYIVVKETNTKLLGDKELK